MKTIILKILITYLTFCSITANNNLFSQTTIAVTPSAYYHLIGDTVKVIVKITNVTNMHSVSVTVRFNNSIIKYIKVSNPGGITFGNWLGNQPVNSLVTDSVIVDQALMGPGLNVNGTDTLFTIFFKALANGVSPVILKSLDMRDPNNNAINSTLDSGHVFIGGLVVNAKVFLQGPYNAGTNLMNNNLNTAGYIPNTHPYNVSPWYYGGTESVPSGFISSDTTIVDWVLIELRTSTPGSSTLYRKTGLIKTNGTIVDCIDGKSPVYFKDTASGNFYVVIRHRNHLSVMSAGTLFLTNHSPLYDFTSSLTRIYGGDAFAVNPGVYAMYAGDVNANGQVRYNGSLNDRSYILAILNGNQMGIIYGYYKEDVNMNAQVRYNGTANDRSVILLVLGGNQLAVKNTNVPN